MTKNAQELRILKVSSIPIINTELTSRPENLGFLFEFFVKIFNLPFHEQMVTNILRRSKEFFTSVTYSSAAAAFCGPLEEIVGSFLYT